MSLLLRWLGETGSPQNPVAVHRREQEQDKIQEKVNLQERDEIEKLCNIAILPTHYVDRKLVHMTNDQRTESEMPFGVQEGPAHFPSHRHRSA